MIFFNILVLGMVLWIIHQYLEHCTVLLSDPRGKTRPALTLIRLFVTLMMAVCCVGFIAWVWYLAMFT